MKIAVFTDTFIPNVNGVVTSIVNSSKKLAERGHEIFIFTVKPKIKKRVDLNKNIHVFYYPSVSLFKYPDFSLAMPKPIELTTIIRKIKPDIIHIHTPGLLGINALAIGLFLKIPVIGTYHTLLPDFLKYVPLPKINTSEALNRFTWSYTRNFYNRCNLVITPSIAMKKELKKNKIKKKIIFLSNGVDLKKFHPIKTKKTGTKILHVGRVGYEKNIDILLKSFKELSKTNKKAELIIAGDGPDMQRLKDYAKELNISKKVKFIGIIPNSELPNLYNSADLFATASTIETEGIVILEAMACGLPIVGVNKMAVPSLVKDNKNGFITEPGNTKEIADSMNALLSNKKLRIRMGNESLKVVNDFSLESTIRKLSILYTQIRK